MIYIEYVFIINYFFDFLILLCVSIILKRNIKLKNIFLGSLVGSLTLVNLFIKISLFKYIVSILMSIVTFKYKDIKYTIKNLEYIYLISMIIGGFMYLLKDRVSYIFIILLIPIFLFIYIKNIKEYKNNIDYYHKITFKYKNKTYNLNGYLDTCNKLKDPYLKRPIIVINKKIELDKYILVPIDTINGHNLMKCFKADNLYLDNNIIDKNILIGISPIKFKMEGIDCILNTSICEI